jgi:GNAT superfamily N-acetyltransferase
MDIRHITPQDYPALSALWNRIYTTEPHSARELQQLDAMHEPPCQCARFVMDDGGRLIGSASYMQFVGSYHPQAFVVNVLVDPDYRRRGYGSQLWDDLCAQLAPFAPQKLSAQIREDDPGANRFAKTRGFTEVRRDWEAVLELSTFNPAHYPATLPDGVQIVRYLELPQDATDRRFHALYSELRLDVPRSDPATPISYEQFRKLFLDAPDFYPEGIFFATHRDALIGMTMFWRGELDTALHTGLTGVVRPFRGRGVAKALKVTALTFAKTQGVGRVITDNDTTNLEMIAINDKLGFVKQPAWISLHKTLPDTPQPPSRLG